MRKDTLFCTINRKRSCDVSRQWLQRILGALKTKTNILHHIDDDLGLAEYDHRSFKRFDY
jgi:hypothetical protein